MPKQYSSAPAMQIDAKKAYRAVMNTDGSTKTIDLIGDLRQGFAAGRVADGERVALGRGRPLVVDEEIEMAVVGVEPGDRGGVGLRRGSVCHAVEEFGYLGHGVGPLRSRNGVTEIRRQWDTKVEFAN